MKAPYLTRSGLVARVAGYLQAVGYGIGSILTWQGIPPRPRIASLRTVVLVLGGSEETDTLMGDLSERIFFDGIMHYTYDTVGAMMHQSLFPYSNSSPEELQSDFDGIYVSIQSRLRTQYHLQPGVSGGSLGITCHWEPSSSTAGQIARKLATIYFRELADEVAPCYERIATNTILESVKDLEKRSAAAPGMVLSQDIVRFREYTAAILISLIASLSRDDFRNFKHTTSLDLTNDVDLEEGCDFVDRSFSKFVEFNEAVQLLAAIHAAQDFDFNDLGRSNIVGWRNGIYSVLPNLLLDMKPTAESITLACHDVYYANIRVHDDRSIKSAITKNIIPDSIFFEDQMALGAELSVIEMSQHPWVGRPQTTPPNRHLYLGLERHLHHNDPDICFVGRIDGTVIGAVSVLDVLKGVARSISQPQECSHDEISINVVNVQTSAWVDQKNALPVGTVETPALLAVKDDPSWALFAMGQSLHYQSCIVLRCITCAHQAATYHKGNLDSFVLIGYR